MMALWQEPIFRQIAGQTLRPGGLDLTTRALEWLKTKGYLPNLGLAIDLGAGRGASLNLLADFGFMALGLDLLGDPGLDLDLKEGPKLADTAYLLKANLLQPPLKRGLANLVLLECVLSILEEPRAGLKIAASLLQDGGICLISDLTSDLGQDVSSPNISMSTKAPIKGKRSCMDGARSAASWLALFQEAGFQLLYSADQSQALRELSAKLIWYGGACKGLCELSTKGLGYRLWLVQKEAHELIAV